MKRGLPLKRVIESSGEEGFGLKNVPRRALMKRLLFLNHVIKSSVGRWVLPLKHADESSVAEGFAFETHHQEL